jgi:N-acetylmuramoyl-L-alanine amidase
MPAGRARQAGPWIARTVAPLLVVLSLFLAAAPPEVHAQPQPQAQATPTGNSGAVIRAARAEDQGAQTRLTFEAAGPFDPAIFVVSDPPRLMIDTADTRFEISPADAALRTSLVSGLRFGLLAPGRSRLVVDLIEPSAIESAVLEPAEGGRVTLRILLRAVDEAAFRSIAARGAIKPSAPAPAVAAAPAVGSAAKSEPRGRRPVVVLDAGHGGLDPGAVGANGVLEKDIVLAVARKVQDLLEQRQRYTVVMTRANDTFVPLDQRLVISQDATADLFVSIHADSLEATDQAARVRGATVYTLSDRASDEQARRLADKENAADLLAGAGAAGHVDSDPVREILFDLLGRETAKFSSDFRGLLVRELGKSIELSREPRRSAAFRVLRQAQTPAVLIELGYMSNAQDQALMTTPTWQRKVAASIADAVDAFFARRPTTGGGPKTPG